MGNESPFVWQGKVSAPPGPSLLDPILCDKLFSMLQPVSSKAQPTLRRPSCLWHLKAPARRTAARCANSAGMGMGRECWWYRDHWEWSNLLLKIATPILQLSETNQRLQNLSSTGRSSLAEGAELPSAALPQQHVAARPRAAGQRMRLVLAQPRSLSLQ